MKRFLDTSTWIALTIDTHPLHASARGWYEDAPLARGELLFCRSTEQSFLRLITQAQVMNRCGIEPLTNEQAGSFLENVYADPAVAQADEPPATRALWLEFAKRPTASPNVWMDAYLSAFAIALGAELVTFDRGFVSFVPNGLVVRTLSASAAPGGE